MLLRLFFTSNVAVFVGEMVGASGVAKGEGASEGTHPEAQALGAHTLFFSNFKTTCFKQKLRPKYAKKCPFFLNCKKLPQRRGLPPPNPRLPPAAGSSAPRPPHCYSHLLLQLYLVQFTISSAKMRFVTFRKENIYNKHSVFASLALLHLKLCSFC